MYLLLYVFFFFSSRRRHTRWPRDWSSDVCSSDLFNWEVDDSIKTTISDIRIQKAKALNPKDSTALTAWFTIDEMNFKHGPEKYWGLPGVILEIKIEFWEEKSLFERFTFKAT